MEKTTEPAFENVLFQIEFNFILSLCGDTIKEKMHHLCQKLTHAKEWLCEMAETDSCFVIENSEKSGMMIFGEDYNHGNDHFRNSFGQALAREMGYDWIMVLQSPWGSPLMAIVGSDEVPPGWFVLVTKSGDHISRAIVKVKDWII